MSDGGAGGRFFSVRRSGVAGSGSGGNDSPPVRLCRLGGGGGPQSTGPLRPDSAAPAAKKKPPEAAIAYPTAQLLTNRRREIPAAPPTPRRAMVLSPEKSRPQPPARERTARPHGHRPAPRAPAARSGAPPQFRWIGLDFSSPVRYPGRRKGERTSRATNRGRRGRLVTCPLRPLSLVHRPFRISHDIPVRNAIQSPYLQYKKAEKIKVAQPVDEPCGACADGLKDSRRRPAEICRPPRGASQVSSAGADFPCGKRGGDKCKVQSAK